jgi:NADPH-dependent glutamate synthase beta subunit-like oxidoreductase
MRAGHDTVVFEKDDRIGGLLRFGIPDFKLAKSIIDRRLDQMMAEGVEFQTGVEVGLDVSIRYLKKLFDGLILTMGAGQPRDLVVPGRGFEGIHFAMEYLAQQNRLNAEIGLGSARPINARDKNVIVIGGGDTGSDCVGTARRQGAKSITQLEILPKPPDARPQDTPWPYWPRTMRTSSSHEEGCDRRWCILTKRFDGAEKTVNRIHGCSVEWFQQQGQWKTREVSGSEFSLPADLILLATGFVHVIHDGLIQDIGLQLDERGNVVIRDFQTSIPSVFAAGDTTNGASLVVRAIDSGRQAAAAVDHWLRNTP